MYKRDADLIEDDIYDLVHNKKELIVVLSEARKLTSSEAFEEYAIHIEQTFDDMMHKPFSDLVREAGYDVEWPKSLWYSAWLHNKDRIITNPATYEAKGESL